MLYKKYVKTLKWTINRGIYKHKYHKHKQSSFFPSSSQQVTCLDRHCMLRHRYVVLYHKELNNNEKRSCTQYITQHNAAHLFWVQLLIDLNFILDIRLGFFPSILIWFWYLKIPIRVLLSLVHVLAVTLCADTPRNV